MFGLGKGPRLGGLGVPSRKEDRARSYKLRGGGRRGTLRPTVEQYAARSHQLVQQTQTTVSGTRMMSNFFFKR